MNQHQVAERADVIAKFHWLPHSTWLLLVAASAGAYPTFPLLSVLLCALTMAMFFFENERFDRHFLQITPTMVVINDGVEARAIPMGAICAVTVHQNWIGRAFNFGTLVFEDQDRGICSIGPVSNPIQFRKIILMRKP